MRGNIKISEIEKKKKQTIKKNKFLLQKLQLISFEQMSQNESTQNVGASNKHLCTYILVDPTISSILQA